MNLINLIKILDLFAGTQSVRKALTIKYNIKKWKLVNGHWIGYWTKQRPDGSLYEIALVDYVGIDVYSPQDQNMIIDLTSDFTLEMILDRLGEWKPDFIWASPVCNKISIASALKGGHNPYFRLDREKEMIFPWEIGQDKTNIHGAANYLKIVGTEKAHKEAITTLKMFEVTRKIIDYFKVAFAIENPRRGYGKYLLKDYKINYTEYCMYGDQFSQKQTIIFTDKKIELRRCNHPKGSHNNGVYGKPKSHNKTLIKNYSDRAAVPPLLIISIMNQRIERINYVK